MMTPQTPFLRYFLISLALILLGILLGVLAAKFLPVAPTPELLVPAPTPTVTELPLETPPPTPTATPSALLSLKWNTMTVKSPNPTLSSYKIFYPTTWLIKTYKNITGKIDSGTSTLVLSKGKSTITLVQNSTPPIFCEYPGDTITEGEKISMGQFREISKGVLIWRTALINGADPGHFQLCEKNINSFFTVSNTIGEIYAENLLDQQTIDEFNYILEKLVILQ